MLLGGMMVSKSDIPRLLGRYRSARDFGHSAKLALRYAADRLKYPRGTRLTMGNALVGRLFHSLRQRRVPILLSTEALSLTESDGRITGALLASGGERIAVRSHGGVILATGGFSQNPEMRRRLLPPAASPHSPVAEGAQGEGIALGERAGGRQSIGEGNGFWSPVSLRRRRDGSMAVFPHLVLDRGKPGADLRLAEEDEGMRDDVVDQPLQREFAPAAGKSLVHAEAAADIDVQRQRR